jgi:MFS family permease
MKLLGHVRWHHRWKLRHGPRAHLGPQFAKISGAGIASNAADGILFAALPLTAAQLTRDPLLVSLAAVVHGLPWLLFELISGEIVDRTDRRRLMVGGNMARATSMLVLAVLVATDAIPSRPCTASHSGSVSPRPWSTRRGKRWCRDLFPSTTSK